MNFSPKDLRREHQKIKRIRELPVERVSIDQALIACSSRGEFECARFCIQEGANIHFDDNRAFRYAVWNGHVEIAELFLSLQMNDNRALQSAIERGNLEMIRLLLRYGGDPDILTPDIQELVFPVIEFSEYLRNEFRVSRIRELPDQWILSIENQRWIVKK